MYHAKHPEASRRPGYYTAAGAFMGFESEDDCSDIEDVERVGCLSIIQIEKLKCKLCG